MRHNESILDRWLRIIIGVALIALVFTGPQTQWGWLGLIPLLTGLFGYCPLYAAFGWSTCHRPGHDHA